MTHRAVSHLCGDARKQTDGSRGLRLNGKRLCRVFGFAYLRLSNTVMAVVQDSNLIPFNLLSVQLFKPYFIKILKIILLNFSGISLNRGYYNMDERKNQGAETFFETFCCRITIKTYPSDHNAITASFRLK